MNSRSYASRSSKFGSKFASRLELGDEFRPPRRLGVAGLIAFATLLLLGAPLRAQEQLAPPPGDPLLAGLPEGLYAHFETSAGAMVIDLAYKSAPNAVYNFVTLARGERSWLDPQTKQPVQRPFYDGLKFFRLAPGLLIQTGSPTNEGDLGPGYTFKREVRAELKHDDAGILAMLTTEDGACHGSQLYITLAPAPNLDGHFAIFGRVLRGKDVLADIGAGRCDEDQRALEPVTIKRVTVLRIGREASDWDPARAARRPEPPAPTSEPLPERLYKPLAKADDRASVQLIVLHYQGLPGANIYCPYSRDDAFQRAQRIAALARCGGADFAQLEKEWSDEPIGARTISVRPALKAMMATFGAALRLGEGQVSEPLDLPIGWTILYRPPVVMARHVLIAWKSPLFPKVTRSKEAALLRALELRRRVFEGEAFIPLLQAYHDPILNAAALNAKVHGREYGGSADYARHEAPPIGAIAFELMDGEVSPPVETEQGYLVVQRIKPIDARHILVSWKGNKRVPHASRDRAGARAFAEALRRRWLAGEAFESLQKLGDDRAPDQGVLTDIAPDFLFHELTSVAFALEPGAVSEIVETPAGFHIIQRMP